MSFGIEVFNPSGVKKLSTADRLTKLHSVHAVNASGGVWTEVFIAVSGMSDDGTWVVQGYADIAFARVASGGFYYQLNIYLSDPNTYYISVFQV